MREESPINVHREWLGYVQPVGLLVAPAALVHRGVLPDRNIAALQESLDTLVRSAEKNEPKVWARDFPLFAQSFLGWASDDLAGAPAGPHLSADLVVDLIEYGEHLIPTYAVVAAERSATPWQMLIRVESSDVEFDRALPDDGKRWAASPHARFERLLRETNVPIGLLTNGRSFRLVYAPKGETSGFADFDLEQMLEVSGRPMLSAFHMLLKVERLYGAPEQNLPALLAESREYQETVSKELAEQVVGALSELLRGFHAADLRTLRTTTVDLALTDPDHIYAGLLTALLRLVFILYAEDRDLFPRNDVWERNYALGGLFERLRDDAALYPDTMDDRYGAWPQLLSLWRLIYAGGTHGDLHLVARRGQMFDPDRFPFLEGRATDTGEGEVPSVSDGVVWRVLRSLMMLHGERLSYRTLDVEQLGSVYQSVMGFTINLTTGPSLAIKPPKRSGAAATIDIAALLKSPAAKRSEWIRERTDRKLSAKIAASIKAAKTLSDLETALADVVDTRVTSRALPAGVPVLQPTEARRRTGSHYTPRRLTAPIVTEGLRPIFERLGDDATAEQILALRILDPALGSGAFLVEACRQLAERLTQAWERHRSMPALPADEDAIQHARRLVVQRCLYGVDRNPMAVDLAKLSLWLATLARDHEFTFLDHAVRCGDALLGLSLKQIEAMQWPGNAQLAFVSTSIRERVALAITKRERIRTTAGLETENTLRTLLVEAEEALDGVRRLGDALIEAFFAGETSKERENRRKAVIAAYGSGDSGWLARIHDVVASFSANKSIRRCFHWELEFPEVFVGDDPGFDAVVGNPPYAGKNTLSASNVGPYIAWLQTLHEGAHGNADLVAHFFRRGFDVLRSGGTLSFVGTNTIRQGDTRATGLYWIRRHSGVFYNVTTRYRWTGDASVLVSVVHLFKGAYEGRVYLDGRDVERITAYLFANGDDSEPVRLAANANQSFQGSIPLGMGFTFDDRDTKGVASSLALMHELIRRDPRNAERIKPYIGGKEVLTDPQQRHHRYIIDFGDMTRNEASGWPELLRIVEDRVRPERASSSVAQRRERWWNFTRRSAPLYEGIRWNAQVLVKPRTASRFALSFLPNGMVYDQTLIVFSLGGWAAFAALQSRIHETWATFFGITLGDTLRYTPSDVFETFPFPSGWNENTELETLGQSYYHHRATLMHSLNEGLTKTYNRFHKPAEVSTGIVTLRALQDALDCAMFAAYGWEDLTISTIFEPDWTSDDGDGPIRLTWPAKLRETVLARLLVLNAERAAQERRLGISHRTRETEIDENDVLDDLIVKSL